MSVFWKLALDELLAGRSVFVAIVAAAKKGSPGTSAARMLVTEGGVQYGTIGGGIMEKNLLDEAKDSLASRTVVVPELRLLKHTRNSENASGLICGGEQTNIIFTLDQNKLELVKQLSACEETEAECILHISHKGFSIELSTMIDRSNFVSLGETWCYSYSFVNPRRIAIFGGGHCGVALAKLMTDLDYAVTIIDPRSNLFTLNEVSEDVNVIFDSFETAASLVNWPEKTISVVMTYSMDSDVDALSSILNFDYRSIGVMGSQAKITRIQKKLTELEFPLSRIKQIRAPLGLQFNSDTPAEIAISIAAQILLERENN